MSGSMARFHWRSSPVSLMAGAHLPPGGIFVLMGCLAWSFFAPAPCAAGALLQRDPDAPMRARPDSASSTTSLVSRGVPTAAELATLQARVDHHLIRLHIGKDAYDLRGARFGSTGVAFAEVKPLARSVFEPPTPLPASPVAWDRIDRITVQKPCALRGAVVGSLLGAGATIALAVFWNATYHGDVGAGAAVILALPPAGAILGGAVGAATFRSEPGWQRADSGAKPAGSVAADSAGRTGAPPPGAPIAAAPLLPAPPIGVLRDEIGARPIRLWAGPDRYQIRHPRLEASGIAFDARNLRTLSSHAYRHGSSRLSPPSSPIPWDRADRVEVVVPSASRGATLGMILGVVLLAGASSGSGSGTAAGAILVGAPVGAVVGGGIGALIPHSKLVWERPASAPPGP